MISVNWSFMKRKLIILLALVLPLAVLVFWLDLKAAPVDANANKALVTFNLMLLEVHLKRYMKDNDGLPPSLADLEIEDPDLLIDPWGRPFIYQIDSNGFTLRTYGADGVSGGDDEDTIRVFKN